jgi:hypothetical protein
MPLSSDPDRRRAQLANLRRGGPPPEPGNRRALRHGAFATIPRDQLGEELREIYEALAASAPLRGEDGGLPVADEAAVEVAARALKRWRAVWLWCETFGRFEERTGARKPAADYELDCERALARALGVLGLDPTSRSKLGLDLARGEATLAELMAADAEREGRERA